MLQKMFLQNPQYLINRYVFEMNDRKILSLFFHQKCFCLKYILVNILLQGHSKFALHLVCVCSKTISLCFVK